MKTISCQKQAQLLLVLSSLVFTGAIDAAPAAAPDAASDPKSTSSASDRPTPSSNDRFDGDHLTLRTTIWDFDEVGSREGRKTGQCAPAETKFVVAHEVGEYLYVRFLSFPGTGNDLPPEDLCPKDDRVKSFTTYKIPRESLAVHDYKRTGFAFGALVVPFKFRFGDKQILASSTVAPYLGWRTGWFQSRGLSFTPVFSAGLALVPVTDPQTSKSETKNALSISLGLVLGSSKNETFQAGLLLGRDFLSSADRANDPESKNPWISGYIGYNF